MSTHFYGEIRDLAEESMNPLTCHKRLVTSPFGLLPPHENGLTFALGYLLASDCKLLSAFLRQIGAPHPGQSVRELNISLQESSPHGTTDIEICDSRRRLHVVIEAKTGGWPGVRQMERYADRLMQQGAGAKVIVALGHGALPQQLTGLDRVREDVHLISLSWQDIAGLMISICDRQTSPVRGDARNFVALIKEVTGMRTYDREVLVRDSDYRRPGFRFYHKYNLYVCQAKEKAEPLFLAPYCTHTPQRVYDGIHWFSRVYCRGVVSEVKSRKERNRVLAEAGNELRIALAPIMRKKGAAAILRELNELPDRWQKGLARNKPKTWSGPRAIYFLGPPMRLPLPIKKGKGAMIPIGFSLTVEQLMLGGQHGQFNC